MAKRASRRPAQTMWVRQVSVRQESPWTFPPGWNQ